MGVWKQKLEWERIGIEGLIERELMESELMADTSCVVERCVDGRSNGGTIPLPRTQYYSMQLLNTRKHETTV